MKARTFILQSAGSSEHCVQAKAHAALQRETRQQHRVLARSTALPVHGRAYIVQVLHKSCYTCAAFTALVRSQVYEGVHALAQRQFGRAAAKFLDAVATFTAAELFPYERCVFYAVVAAIITLPRPELKKKACAHRAWAFAPSMDSLPWQGCV